MKGECNNLKKSKVIDVFGIILTVLAVIFLIRRIIALDVDFAKIITPTNIAVMVTMPFVSVVVIFINSYCWKSHLQLFSKKILEGGETFRVYAQANLMKYLPGNIAHYAGRQLYGGEIGIRQAVLIKASVFEIIYSIFSILLGCVFFSMPNIIKKPYYVFLKVLFIRAVIVFCILLMLISTVIYFMKNNKYILEFFQLVRLHAFWNIFLKSVLFCSIGTLLVAMEYVVLVGQYGEIDFDKMVVVLFANYLSVLIGYVTPGVSGGIGVREVILIKVLSPFFQEDIVILAAVIHRIILILGDLLAVPVSWMLKSQSE